VTPLRLIKLTERNPDDDGSGTLHNPPRSEQGPSGHPATRFDCVA
jgi:hypothetical protein